MNDKPLFAPELAAALGISVLTLHKRWRRLHLLDQMPPPIGKLKPLRWHRPSIEAWLWRWHPTTVAMHGRPKAANDQTPTPLRATPADNASYDEWRDYFIAVADAYGSGRSRS